MVTSTKRKSPLPQETRTSKYRDTEINTTPETASHCMRNQKKSTDFNINTIEPAQLESLEHMVTNLAIGLEELKTKFSWLMTVNLDDVVARHPNKLVKALAKRPRVKFAEGFMHSYKQGNLPVVDDFIKFKSTQTVKIPEQFVGSLNAESLDALQGQLILNSQADLEALQKRFKTDKSMFKKTIGAIQALSEVPEVETSSKAQPEKKQKNQQKQQKQQKQPESSSDWPPALPSIDDPELLKAVFTHKSFLDLGTKIRKSELLSMHNERLEFIGDTVLGFFISNFVYNRFPESDEGFLTVTKASLVCNDTLFDLAVAYGMHEKLAVSDDMRSKMYKEGPNGQYTLDKVSRSKAVADVFESYVGGLATSKGLGVVEVWLRQLYKPLISAVQQQDPPDKGAKNDLYRKIGSNEQPIEYTSVNTDGPPFTVQCSIGGTIIATGTDRSIKAAGLRAAEEVLKNERLVEKYAARRRNLTSGH